jgi:hypothetical protein
MKGKQKESKVPDDFSKSNMVKEAARAPSRMCESVLWLSIARHKNSNVSDASEWLWILQEPLETDVLPSFRVSLTSIAS